MSEELQDEVTSINSIYGEGTLVPLNEQTAGLYALVLPAIPEISLRFDFPNDYPAAPPSVLGTQSVGHETAKGMGNVVVGVVRDTLAEIYMPGVPCVFDLLEEAGQRLQQLRSHGPERSFIESEDTAVAEAIGQDESTRANHSSADSDLVGQPQEYSDLDKAPPWVLSEVITEKKSVFIARAVAVTSVDQANGFLAHLLSSDKKVAKATHNMTAWRIRGQGEVQYQDCDDDGETAAGGRMLHLLELMDVWNVMVVVTRWYGGVHLGPDRFRLINQCARDAITRGGFNVIDDAKEKGKKRTKK